MPLPLRTERLILRAFSPEDAPAFAAYRSDPRIAQYQGWSAPYPLEQARAFIASLQAQTPGIPGRWYQIAIQRQSDGLLLGDCAFIRLVEDERQAEIAFTLAREYQGQGYASEAVTGLLGYLFAEYELHRVRANCDPENLASARLMLRLGMRHEGRFVDSLWVKGRYASEDWFAILRSEWKSIRE